MLRVQEQVKGQTQSAFLFADQVVIVLGVEDSKRKTCMCLYTIATVPNTKHTIGSRSNNDKKQLASCNECPFLGINDLS